MSATAVWVSDDLTKARQQVRWFPALVSNHVVDLITRYQPGELPDELTAYVRDRKGIIISTTPRWVARMPISCPMTSSTATAWWGRYQRTYTGCGSFRKPASPSSTSI